MTQLAREEEGAADLGDGKAGLPVCVSREACPSPHGLGNKAGRALWAVAWGLLFRPSPKILYGWRRFLLRCFGARIGPSARVMPSARIWAPWNLSLGEDACLSHDVDCYCVDRIVVGDHATVSQYSFLCTATHDDADPHMRLVTRPIAIGPGAWVCADAFVGPGVTIGEGAVVGARSSVFSDVPPWQVYAGTPARYLRDRVIRQPERNQGIESRQGSAGSASRCRGRDAGLTGADGAAPSMKGPEAGGCSGRPSPGGGGGPA